ncbi:hypothetical protein [Wolbachia endosymbiont of Pentidionis agamae]|uniref:hypothetical protein n=1 Tax=Wolbachia endosymbiont of Pentidionis agamae TaxID=3110435 RepID=UPI002FD6CE5C
MGIFPESEPKVRVKRHVALPEEPSIDEGITGNTPINFNNPAHIPTTPPESTISSSYITPNNPNDVANLDDFNDYLPEELEDDASGYVSLLDDDVGNLNDFSDSGMYGSDISIQSDVSPEMNMEEEGLGEELESGVEVVEATEVLGVESAEGRHSSCFGMDCRRSNTCSDRYINLQVS